MNRHNDDDDEIRMVPGIPRPVGPGDTFDPEKMDPKGWAAGRYRHDDQVRITIDRDAIVINAAHRRAISSMEGALRGAAECGRLLLAKKAAIGHGGWLAWVRDNCEFSRQQAVKYMTLAGKVQMTTGSGHLNFAPAAPSWQGPRA